MALERLGLLIFVQGLAEFTNSMRRANDAVDGTADGFDEAGGSADGMSDSLDTLGSSTRDAEQRMRDIRQATTVAGAALIGLGAAGLAVARSTVMVAARNSELGTVLQTLGRNAGYTESEIRGFESGLTSLGITTQSSRQALLQMIQANMNLADSTRLARLAQDAAVIANLNSSEAFERLITVVQRGEIVMARTMGLNVDFQGSYERLAESLGVTVDELDEQQRMQARVNEVMRAGESIAGSYESAMTEAGKAMRSLERHVEEAQAAIGEALLPVLASAVEVTTNAFRAFRSLDETTQGTIGTMLLWGSATTIVIGKLFVLHGQLPALIASVKALGVALSTTALGPFAAAAAAIGVIGWSIHEANRRTDEWYRTLRSLRTGIEEVPWEDYERWARAVGITTGVVTEATWRAMDAESRRALQLQHLATELARVNEEQERAARSGRVVLTQRQEALEWERQLIEITQRGIDVQNDAAQAYSDVGARMAGLASNAQDATGAIGDMSEETRNFDDAARELQEAIRGDLGEAIDDFAGGMRELGRRQAELRAGIDELNSKPYLTAAQREQLDEWRSELGEVGDSMEELRERHRLAIAGIIFDMVLARLAVDGFTEDEMELATTVAEAMGLIDSSTARAMSSVNNTLSQFDEDGNLEAAQERIWGIVDGMTTLDSTEVDIRMGYQSLRDAHGAAMSLLDILNQIGGARAVAQAQVGAGFQENQHGTMSSTGGVSLVGEAGPEMVYLPRGARVLPAGATQQIVRDTMVNAPISATINNGMDAAQFRLMVEQAVIGALQ